MIATGDRLKVSGGHSRLEQDQPGERQRVLEGGGEDCVWGPKGTSWEMELVNIIKPGSEIVPGEEESCCFWPVFFPIARKQLYAYFVGDKKGGGLWVLAQKLH